MKHNSSLVHAILGTRPKSSVQEEVSIPVKAEQYKSTAGVAPDKDPAKELIRNGSPVNEPLMEPALALVAPDATPGALRPLSPSLLPEPAAATTAPVPTPVEPPKPVVPGTAAINALLGITDESLRIHDNTFKPMVIPGFRKPALLAEAEAKNSAAAALTRGNGMPAHVVTPVSLGIYNRWKRSSPE